LKGWNNTELKRKNELIWKIFQVCLGCPHLKGTNPFRCDRKKSQCHSKRVQRWLRELGNEEKSQVSQVWEMDHNEDKNGYYR